MSDYTTFELERMAAGEIEIPPDAAERVAALARENDEVLQRYPAADVVPQIRAGANSPKRRRAPVVLALAGIAALLLVALWPSRVIQPPPEEPRVRLKGPQVRLTVYKRSTDGDIPLEPGDHVSAGDLVQARFGIAAGAFVAHYSEDALGTVTPIEPPTMDAPTVRYEGGTHRAPTATELDDAPQFERFVVVACDDSFIVDDLVARVRDGTLPESCQVETVELRK